MPLIFYSSSIAAIVSILGIKLAQHDGFDMVGPLGAIFAVVTFLLSDLLLNLFQLWKSSREFDSENKARGLLGLPERKF